jgi:hypothetical protein
MEITIGCVVEGHGDVSAVPVLIRRLIAQKHPDITVHLPRPVRIPRSRLIKEGELERAAALAALNAGPAGGVLVLFDADDDCPAEMAPGLVHRMTERLGDRPCKVVLAKHEFESWLIAAAVSISGRRGLVVGLTRPGDPESIRDAKGWLSDHMQTGRKYRETLDQDALAAVFDLDAARSAPSFDKLVRDLEHLVERLGRDRSVIGPYLRLVSTDEGSDG